MLYAIECFSTSEIIAAPTHDAVCQAACKHWVVQQDELETDVDFTGLAFVGEVELAAFCEEHNRVLVA